jgi:putative spermidine/putrescine transport system ATP-binding protein
MMVPNLAQSGTAGDKSPESAAVRIIGLSKHYGDVKALAPTDLTVNQGEFFTLLGPSGSGKTTLLRLIAGFERPDGGMIELAGQDVTKAPPYARDVNTVFQDYALFPHMTIAENIEYGLKVRRVARPSRKERVQRALDMVQLSGYGDRKPAQLSGGQRQRVALARAIVNEPQVLLLDEPLGALDLKLRQHMQRELLTIQREVGITFIYVTHDQEEALTMSDRIAVLNQGSIEQIGNPVEVYERPRTAFVADFIGVSNLIQREGRQITIRPEKITLLVGDDQAAPGAHVESATIRDVIYAGVLTRYVVELEAGGELVVSRQNTQSSPGGATPRTPRGEPDGKAMISGTPSSPGGATPRTPRGEPDGKAMISGTPSSPGGATPKGARVRVAWPPDQAFTIPEQAPGASAAGSGEG